MFVVEPVKKHRSRNCQCKIYYIVRQEDNKRITSLDSKLYADHWCNVMNSVAKYVISKGNKWIDVNEKLPEERVRVLACNNQSGFSFIAEYGMYSFESVRSNSPFWIFSMTGTSADVTHWMPLPKLPESPPEQPACPACEPSEHYREQGFENWKFCPLCGRKLKDEA